MQRDRTRVRTIRNDRSNESGPLEKKIGRMLYDRDGAKQADYAEVMNKVS